MATTIDIIILACGIAALAWGVYKGLTSQVIGIIGIVLGLWLASLFTPTAAKWVGGIIGSNASQDIIKIVVYVLIVILIVIACKLLGRLIDKVFSFTILGGVNTILGAIFCLAKVLIILAVIATLIMYANNSLHLDSIEALKQSRAFNFLLQTADTILPYIKRLFAR